MAEHVLPSLIPLERHRPFYLRVVETAATAEFFGQLVDFVKAGMTADVLDSDVTLDGTPLRDVIDIVAGGCMWLVVGWLRGEQRGAPQEIAARVAAMASLVHQNKTARA